ncbi:MAG: pantoate--beta-alanine ligase [Saprospiraceae bacterium]|nr:pantoate--beta-alanine ligase [Saprospiraceae bacterium]
MLLIRNNAGLKVFIAQLQKNGQRIGFVPTMGALHEGHLSLIQQAAAQCDVVVCSIFVNPTQFNDPADLEKYPRPITRDIELLQATGCDVLYMPDVEDIYPPDLDTTLRLNPGKLIEVMEGEFRPGHFEGVMQVVKRLLDLVTPDVLVMGQKDYQQVAVIRFMIQKLRLPVTLYVAETERETDGLAKSSRNVRLTQKWRSIAPVIYQTLSATRDKLGTLPPKQLAEAGFRALEAAGLRPEYYRIVDGVTLLDLEKVAKNKPMVVCTAAWAGDVRLIDNVILQP